ncbi:MAG: PAS domain-containing sensor histidine kinase [Pseudobdellovibrio sp.]
MASSTAHPDETGQSRLVEKLSAETNRLHESQAVASVGSWETDLNTYDVIWTAETYRIFEVNSSEFHPTHEKFLQMVHPDDRASVAAAFTQSLTVTDAFSIEHRICLPSGGIKVVEERWRSFRDDTGKIARVLGTCQDITTRKQNEEKLMQHQTMLRIAGRIAKLGGWRIDLPENKLFWSDETAIIHDLPAGYTPSLEEAIGFYPPEYREKTAELVRLLITEGAPFDFEHELLTAKGRRIWVRAIGEAKRNSSGQIVQVYGAFQDITENKRLEAQFLRAQRMESVGTLSSGIAHDLNNILAPIMLSVEILQMGAKDEASVRMLKTLESCSQRGANLVKQLLSFARGLEGQRIEVDLEILINELHNMMKEVFPKDIFFEISLGANLRKVVGDPSQLHQVIFNLCVNARDAMSGGGKLTISAENIDLDKIYAAMNPDHKSGSYVLIKVTDTGEGISPAVMDKIFDPFFTTKELGKGTGLGLATVMGIVRSQGGFVKVYSEVGKGTKFEVYLSAERSAHVPLYEK